MKKISKIIVAATTCVAVAAAVVTGVLYFSKDDKIVDAGKTVTDYDETRAIYLDDKRYLPDPDIFTFLIAGVDKTGPMKSSGSITNDSQADFLAVVAYDTNKNTCKILHINRDTIADVPVIGSAGTNEGTKSQQISLSYTYGDGLKQSAGNTVKAVEKLLGGIDIKNYVAVQMDAVKILNDKIGGVPVQITEDMSSISREMTRGKTVTLNGDTAVEYLKRMLDVSDGTNTSRMQRQQGYVMSFYNKLKTVITNDKQFINNAFVDVADYIVTDCDFARVTELQAYVEKFPEATVHEIQGEIKTVNGQTEFHPDEQKLKELCVELFYVQSEVKE